MAARRRIDPAAGAQALRQWAQEQDTSGDGSADGTEGATGAASASDSVSPRRVRRPAPDDRHRRALHPRG
ncbi:hypothetical protein HMPREF0975_02783, partial [Actinomyces sp. oral taxon 849 str. F0330]